MRRFRWFAIFAPAAWLAVVPAAWGQQSGPRAGYVFPAGGRQGSTFSVTIGGQRLDGAAKALVSGSGVRAEVLQYFRATPQGQFNALREQLKRMQQKKLTAVKKREQQPDEKKIPANARWTDEDEKAMLELRKRVVTSLRGPPVASIGETVTVQVTLAADAEPGPRELRLETPKGLTNPLVFCVGRLQEFFAELPGITDDKLFDRSFRYRDEPRASPPAPAAEIKLPATVNGQVMPGGSDRFRFAAKKGQQLVIAAAARELIPYISDAVPGWLQAAVTLYDEKGRELAYADHYSFHPDPVIFYKVPEDGQYVAEIRDSIYRGREDFVYRLTVGEIPFVTGIFPLGGPAGEQTAVELAGWNLPLTRLTLDAEHKEPGVYPLAIPKDWMSHGVRFAVDSLPECLEKEPHNRPENAQRVSLPIIVNGRIDPADQWDVFSFEGRAGEQIVAEVNARRLDSPLDSLLKLTDAGGRQLAINDDYEDKGSGLETHHADSYLRATLPAQGTYYLYLGDAQHQGGPDYVYRLRIGPPRPDFELRVVPASVTVRGGASVPLTVYALRKDGFSGPIALSLMDDPEGYSLSDPVVPAGQDHVQLMLKAALTQEQPLSLSLEGRATIDSSEVVRRSVPAEDMMQAFEYRHLVSAQEMRVAVSGRFTPRVVVKLLSKTPVKIPAGGTARVQIGGPWRSFFNKVRLELRTPPAGITLEKSSPVRDGVELVLQSDAAKVKLGLKGSLYLTASTEKPPEAAQAKVKGRGDPSRKLPSMPAIPFVVVGPEKRPDQNAK